MSASLRPRPALLAGALALLSSAAGCGDGPSGEEPASASTPAPVRVTAVRARTMTLHPELELVGRVVPRPESVARLAARVAGTVASLRVVEGSRVGAGDPLVELDPTLFESEVERTAAAVAEREAVLERLENGPLEEELEIARQELHRAEIVAKNAALKRDALQELASHAELSPVRQAEARAAEESADADVAAARASLALLEAGTRPELVREARSALAAARAVLEAARARLGFTAIEAPFAGTVTRLEARAGLGVSAGSPLVEVTDLSTVLVRVRVPAEALAALDREGPCTASFDALSAPLTGRLDRLGPRAEASTGGVWAYVAVANPGELLAGMGGRVVLPLRKVEGCTAIPAVAAAERSGTPVVTLVRDGVAHEVPVRIGARAGGWIQVVEGVSPGEWVATDGGYGLPEGQPVRLSPGPKPR